MPGNGHCIIAKGNIRRISDLVSCGLVHQGWCNLYKPCRSNKNFICSIVFAGLKVFQTLIRPSAVFGKLSFQILRYVRSAKRQKNSRLAPGVCVARMPFVDVMPSDAWRVDLTNEWRFVNKTSRCRAFQKFPFCISDPRFHLSSVRVRDQFNDILTDGRIFLVRDLVSRNNQRICRQWIWNVIIRRNRKRFVTIVRDGRTCRK